MSAMSVIDSRHTLKLIKSPKLLKIPKILNFDFCRSVINARQCVFVCVCIYIYVCVCVCVCVCLWVCVCVLYFYVLSHWHSLNLIMIGDEKSFDFFSAHLLEKNPAQIKNSNYDVFFFCVVSFHSNLPQRNF